jgi:nuclear transcription Y subunit beta
LPANEAQLCHPDHYTKRLQPLQLAIMSDSQSPPKDVDQGAQSPEDEGQMNDSADPQSGGLAGYEFEGVKEQDRWLPIANVARIMMNALPDYA